MCVPIKWHTNYVKFQWMYLGCMHIDTWARCCTAITGLRSAEHTVSTWHVAVRVLTLSFRASCLCRTQQHEVLVFVLLSAVRPHSESISVNIFWRNLANSGIFYLVLTFGLKHCNPHNFKSYFYARSQSCWVLIKISRSVRPSVCTHI